MTRIALLDGHHEPTLGHHPDLLVGLAEASLRLPEVEAPTLIYCPDAFVADRTLPAGVAHRPFVRPADEPLELQRKALEQLCAEAADAGVQVLINLFLDETHQLFPVDNHGLRLVHALHRPREFADSMMEDTRIGRDMDRVMAAYLSAALPADDLVVVHQAEAYASATRWLPAERVLGLAWPSASSTEIAQRFASAVVPAGEPHALLIGNAKRTKGVHDLLAALAEDKTLLRIVGQQSAGVETTLTDAYPDTRVDWETGWVNRDRLGQAIAAASVVVFPYLEEFGRHNGASGALVQALTFAKPVVVSTVLADQLPPSDAVLLVEPGDVDGLRRAVAEAIDRSGELHQLAQKTLADIQNRHSYDRHLHHILAKARS